MADLCRGAANLAAVGHWSVGGVAAIMVVVLVGGGCTDGDVEATPTTTGPKPSPTVRSGEHTPDPAAELCRAVSRRTLQQLDMGQAEVSVYGECSWSQDESSDRRSIERELTVGYRTFTPPLTRRDYTATKEARARFRRLSGWGGVPTVPVAGFGDEAKVARFLQPSGKGAQVWLAVRDRNTIVQVKAVFDSLSPSGHDALPTFDRVEEGAVAAAGDLLEELTGKRPAKRPVSAHGDGEIEKVHPVCGMSGADRLVPGGRRWDISRRGPRARGCAWTDDGDYAPSLVVDVEALTPSATAGDTATELARRLYYANEGEKLTGDGLGDEAKLDWYVYDGGKSRTAQLLVRQRNLLVYVEYERWRHPDARQMRQDAIAVARDVLRKYA